LNKNILEQHSKKKQSCKLIFKAYGDGITPSVHPLVDFKVISKQIIQHEFEIQFR